MTDLATYKSILGGTIASLIAFQRLIEAHAVGDAKVALGYRAR